MIIAKSLIPDLGMLKRPIGKLRITSANEIEYPDDAENDDQAAENRTILLDEYPVYTRYDALENVIHTYNGTEKELAQKTLYERKREDFDNTLNGVFLGRQARGQRKMMEDYRKYLLKLRRAFPSYS